MPKFRIRHYPRGFVAEVQKEKGWLFKKRYWTHYVSVSGIPSEPWHFSSHDNALNGLLHQLRRETIENSR
ncbi:hypothetical protein [Pontibacter sp. BT731]|uniref:hypothetical protein n=1 Tax=Pontibacter coccineus TaxID=3063328 RepID=UPI0026E1E4C8|nr:hypothetical protein [Pontibacter sp. BT731]